MDNEDIFEEEQQEESLDEFFTHVQPKKSYFIYKMIGFFIPLVGFILYFVYRKEQKEEASAFLDGALVGIFTQILLSLLIVGYINSLH